MDGNQDRSGKDGLKGPMRFVYAIIIVGAAILIGTFLIAGRGPHSAADEPVIETTR